MLSGGPWRHLGRVGPVAVIVALVACVLVPLPTPLVDLLLSLSLAGAVMLLVAAWRVRHVSQLGVFPVLILLATLYRLVLNVSTTRLILSQADAGRVVDAFANIVVRGDLVIGAVVFAIVTLIQYLVIARGSERVAEVTARFALDALPGQQASIDADLQRGAISSGQARERRDELLARSMFHGAMDGAVRFVRHDAIAGLCITAINMVGGVAIGMTRFGLDVGESLDTFGRLTIGDGLLSQIPALLVSLAASVLVARTDHGPSRRWIEPVMLVAPAVLLLGLAAIPGMPAAAFVVTGLGLLTVAAATMRRTASDRPSERRPRVHVVVSRHDFPDLARLDRGLAELRGRCHDELALGLPRFVARHGEIDGHVTIDYEGTRITRHALDGLDGSDLESRLWVATFRAILSFAPAFIDLQVVDEWIETVARSKPAIANEAAKVLDRPALCELCRALVRERIGMPPMATLLQLVATDPAFRQTKRTWELVEVVRRADARRWLPARLGELTSHDGRDRWRRPTPDFERDVLEASDATETGPRVRTTAIEREAWQRRLLDIDFARVDTKQSDAGHRVRAIVTSAKARRTFADLLRDVSPYVPVVSAIELDAAEFTPLVVEWVDVDRTAVDRLPDPAPR